MKKLMVIVVLSVLLMSSLSSCYINKGVEQFERGLKLKAGTEIEAVVSPGRYTNLGWYSKMPTVNVSALKVEWSDPDLVTHDKQPIGLAVSVTFARRSDSQSIAAMWEEYNYEARDDEALRQQVLARIPRVAKAVTTQFTLDQMLGVGEGGEEAGRRLVQQQLDKFLNEELDEIYAIVKDVGVNNIAPSQDFLDLLEEKANANLSLEVEGAKKLAAEQRLLTTKAETEIQIELARRERLVQEEKAKVFTTNDRWFELKKLEAMQEIFDQNDKVWFLPEGADITLLLSGENIVPVEK